MAFRRWVTLCLVVPAAIAVAGLATQSAAWAAGTAGLTRVDDLRRRQGAEVTVRGRTGQILEDEETAEVRAYTLRDDYGDMVRVRTSDDYPIMGATYDVRGTSVVDPTTGALYLDATSQTKIYGGQATDVVVTRTEVPRWVLPSVLAAIAVGALIILSIVRRIVGGHPAAGALADAWGFVEVVDGPHQGRTFSLREDAVVVGRHLDPIKAVSLDEDKSVSRSHGLIVRDEEGVYYVDTESMNGSFVAGERIAPHERVPISPGARIQLGPASVIRIGRPAPDDADQTYGPEAEFTGQWSDARTERAS